jgi:hypothetical protein
MVPLCFRLVDYHEHIDGPSEMIGAMEDLGIDLLDGNLDLICLIPGVLSLDQKNQDAYRAVS